MTDVKLLDVVVSLVDMIGDEKDVRRGHTGTIVEVFDAQHYLVEFADTHGQTFAMPVMTPDQFVVLISDPVS